MLKKSFAMPAAWVLALVMLLGLTACGGNRTFDAADLLQANLDIIYRGEYTDEVLTSCGISAEEADRMYQNSLNTEVAFFCKYFDIDQELLTDETRGKIHNMYASIYSGVQYTVGTATEVTDGWTVALSVRPRLIMQDFLAADADEIMSAWQQRMDSGEFDLLTDNEREEVWAGGIIDAVSARVDSLDFGPAQELAVRITQDDDGYLAISDEDMEQIDRLMIEY